MEFEFPDDMPEEVRKEIRHHFSQMHKLRRKEDQREARIKDRFSEFNEVAGVTLTGCGEDIYFNLVIEIATHAERHGQDPSDYLSVFWLVDEFMRRWANDRIRRDPNWLHEKQSAFTEHLFVNTDTIPHIDITDI